MKLSLCIWDKQVSGILKKFIFIMINYPEVFITVADVFVEDSPMPELFPDSSIINEHSLTSANTSMWTFKFFNKRY